ncbi:glycoside hydrolase family 2 TIM barrel-domain containing protein [Paenibacillus lupini]|uniref:glycoside hydrolase family 2 TIM barrel-domain containing protein n=1 Tax=Paenibacillus lupini TaxID=1450204 RepID=UPI00141FEF68|nr:glycoside hydrolase family 2 TIM barrel-domain containing protein [Paenibacillus lupini]NIK25055.1 beta-galactosidase [Paenibacillus lupini]
MTHRRIEPTISYVERMLDGTDYRSITSLMENWRCHAGDASGAQAAFYDDSAWQIVQLPHDDSAESDFNAAYPANGYVRSGVLWYRTSFASPQRHVGGKRYLMFDGAAMNAEVWVNGRCLGTHPYAFTPFWFDLTPHLRPAGEENVLAVKVDASLQPFGRSYQGNGLFRRVQLIVTAPLHIDVWGVVARTESIDSGGAVISVATNISVGRYPETKWNAFVWQGNGMAKNNEISKNCRLRTTILDPEDREVAVAESEMTVPQFGKHRFEQRMRVSKPALWSPDQPNLYRVHSVLFVENEPADDALTPLGIRTLLFTAGNGFELNGVEMKIKGVCLHQDAAIFGGAVQTPTWANRLAMLKEAGCNAVRTSHHPFPTEFYHACDYLGMMVMDEAFDEWRLGWDRGYSDSPYGKNVYGYYLYFDQWYETDLRAMLRRDRNHPSVIMWSVGNEIPDLYFDEGIPILRRMVEICKEEDDTRPVTVCAEGNHLLRLREGIMDLVDVPGYNYVASREGDAYYEHLHAERPNRALLGSETEFEPEHWKRIMQNPYVIGQFLWVGIDYLGEGADVLGEDSALGNTFDISALAGGRRGWGFGLIDSVGTPRGEYYFRRSIWDDVPFVRLAVRQPVPAAGETYAYMNSQFHWNWSEGERKKVYVFTNCDVAELFLNGRSLGVLAKDTENYRAIELDVNYVPGTLTAVGLNEGQPVCEDTLVTAGGAARLELSCDSEGLSADGRDFAELRIVVVDKDGHIVPDAAHLISVTVQGSGSLLGVYSADVTSSESYRSAGCRAYRGIAAAIVRAGRDPGAIAIEASAPGLSSASWMLPCVKHE